MLNAMDLPAQVTQNLVTAAGRPLTYENMLDTLRFHSSLDQVSGTQQPAGESPLMGGDSQKSGGGPAGTLYTENRGYRDASRGWYRGRYNRRGQPYGYKKGPERKDSQVTGKNNLGRNGNLKRCYTCNSPDHLMAACPKRVPRKVSGALLGGLTTTDGHMERNDTQVSEGPLKKLDDEFVFGNSAEHDDIDVVHICGVEKMEKYDVDISMVNPPVSEEPFNKLDGKFVFGNSAKHNDIDVVQICGVEQTEKYDTDIPMVTRGTAAVDMPNAVDEGFIFGNCAEGNDMDPVQEISPTHLTFFVGCMNDIQKGNSLKQLVNESKGYAVLDSGCATNVCGEGWLMDYLDTLEIEHREQASFQPSNRHFAFGGGQISKSKGKATIPCWVAGIKGWLETEVVASDIPLLLSRETMETQKFTLNFAERTVTWNGHTIKLKLTSTGHYGLPLHI